jgi:cytochrome P450
MARISLAASVRALFGVDVDSGAEQLVEALSRLRRAISRLPFPWPGLVAARRRLRRATSRLRHGSMVEQLRGAGLSEQAVESEVAAMLFASFDTTSAALAWTWFAIGRHPEVEAKLHAELDEVLGDRVATLEDVPRLRYSRSVITEALRLYPPVHFVDRRALRDVDLGGVRMRAGEYVLLSPLLTQRLARFYDQPARFWPERWQGEGAPRPSRYAYFPFGDGPHVCIGRGLALKVITLTIATLARHWRLKPSPTLPHDPNPNTADLPMIPERRPWTR